MKLETYADRDLLAFNVADALAGDLNNALMANDNVAIAVPGGSTPGPVFDVLCAANLDWSRVTLLPTDERFVPEDDARSNARQIRDRLLTNRAAAAHFLSLRGSAESVEAAAEEATPLVEAVRPISVLLLGMGADMHTASLFAGAAGTSGALSPDAPAVVATHPDAVPEPRLTLSAPVLTGALARHLMITGEEKREALERAMNLPPEEAPINVALAGTTVHWAA